MERREKRFASRILAWFLTFLMITTMIPTSAFAALPAQEAGAVVSEDASSDETTQDGILLKTTLTDKLKVKGQRKLFDVWARDAEDNTLKPTATLDGQALSATWSDNVKTSFTLDFQGMEEGEHTVVISAEDGKGASKTQTYTVIYQKAKKGEFIGYATVSIEAFTISKGYIVEPVLMPVYEGDNAAKAFVNLIREEGYDVEYTGSLTSGFYLSHIVGSNAKKPKNATKKLDLAGAALEPHMAEKLPDLMFDADGGTEGSLGEFDYNYMSGWMYCVNTVFPNVGFADYYLSDGDVMRAQFTLKYGGDIGGSGGMGGGYDDSYSVANKDVLTTTLAKINSAPNSAELKADPDIAAKITEAKEVLQNIVAEQSEVDKVNDELNKLLGGEITSITLDQSEITLENEGTMQLNAKVELTGKPIEPIEWNSEEPSVATVKNGLVTAVGAGTTTITATCGEKTATCKVTVNASPLQEVRLDKSELEILKNDSETLTATLVPANTTDDRTVTWSTNAEDVATVNQSGRVTGKKEGTAVITAKVGDKEAGCTVTVKEVHTQRIYFDDSKLTLNKGKNKTLSLRFDPSNTTDAKKATWESSEPSVASVSTSGYVRALKKGTTTVTAKIGDMTASIEIEVVEVPMTGVKISYGSKSLKVKQSTYMSASYLPSDTTDTKSGTWKSSNTNVATVSSSGKVTAVSEGEAIITFTSGAFTAECYVKVLAANADVFSTISITPNQKEIGCGVSDTQKIMADVGDGTDPVVWTSSNPAVVAVSTDQSLAAAQSAENTMQVGKEAVVTATGKGTAVITAKSGQKSVDIPVTVVAAGMKEFKILAGTNAETSFAYEITPEYNITKNKYQVVIPDAITNVYLYSKLADNVTATVTARYTAANSGSAKNITLRSGATSSAAYLTKKDMNGNTLYVDVKKGDETTTYEFDVVRESTLTSLSVASADGEEVLHPGFDKNVTDYTVSVTDNNDSVKINAAAFLENAAVSVNGTAVTGETSVPLSGDETVITVKAAMEDVPSQAREYKIHVLRKKSVKLTLKTDPADTVITLKDADSKKLKAENGVYTLKAEETYSYVAVKAGYVTKKDTISVTEDTEKTITMEKAPESTRKDVSAAWKNFRNSDDNMGITSAKTPTSEATTYEKWFKKLGSGWGAAPSVQIIVDNSLIVMSANHIYKLDLNTGDILQTGDMVAATNFGYTPPTYADGMIFAPLADGRVQAFNAETLESLWVYQDMLKGQSLSPITYSDGYIYTGFWNAETKDANYVCIPVTDEDPTNTQEAKEAAWQYTSLGGFYWAGSVVRGDYVVFGTDDGTSGSDGTGHVLSLNKKTGAVMDSVDVIGDQRSTIAYDKETDRLYFTTKGGYLYSLKLKSDGTFDKDTLKSVQPGSMSTSTPVVYNGRIYIGVTSGSNFSGTYSISVIDAATMTEVYKAPLKGYPQCSVLLSTAYEKEDGSVYLYATYNKNPGGITLIRDKKGQTTPDVEEIFTPEKARQQYCITSIICDENGTLYYKNDSACVMAVASSEAYMTGITSSAEGSSIDAGAAFDTKANSHKINIFSEAEKTTLMVKASAGSTVTINGVEGNIYNLDLTDEEITVPVVVKKGVESRTYTLIVQRKEPNVKLGELCVTTSNGVPSSSSMVPMTPTFSNDVHEYRAEYSSTKSFLNVWALAQDANATVKVYPVLVGSSTAVNSDGTIPVTATTNTHNRYAIYFGNNDCAKVRVEVISEGGYAKASYFVTIKQKAGNTPVISNAAGVSKDEAAGSITLTSNEYGAFYYKAVPYGETAPESIDTTGEGSGIEVGESTVEVTNLPSAISDVYMVVKDNDAQPHTSNMLKVTIVNKEAAITELNAYKNADDYRDAEKAKITKILANAKVLINNAESAEDVAEQLSDAKADLDKLKTSAELAADEKTQTDADAVKALIEALGDVTLEKKESVEAARNAYDALSTDAKKLVSNYDVLVQAEKTIQTLEAKKQQEELKNQMDAAAAASVSSAITAIEEVTLDKRGVVEAARAAYNTLTEDQKALVTNYTDLTAAENRIAELVQEAADKAEADKAEQAKQEALKAKAQPVVDAIAAIGEVTLDGEEAITAARSAYEALEADVKAKVTNLSDLVVAEKNLALLKAEKESRDKDAAVAASVSSAITAIGEVTLDKRGVVAAARAAYDTLSDVQKSLVTNYSDLQAAESRIAALVKEAADKAEADKAEQAKQEALKAKAQPVIDAIAAIGEVTLNSEKAITAARSAYETLEAEVKEKVTNLSDLVIAEKDLAALKAEKKAAEDLKAQQEEAKRQQEEAKKAQEEKLKAQEEKLKEQEEKLKAEKDKYGFNEKTTLKSAKVKGKKVTLKWNKVKGASGYEIYCKTGKGKWKLVKTLHKGSKASCKLKGKAGKKYTYKVRVFQKVENKVIYGQYSNTKSAKIKK